MAKYKHVLRHDESTARQQHTYLADLCVDFLLSLVEESHHVDDEVCGKARDGDLERDMRCFNSQIREWANDMSMYACVAGEKMRNAFKSHRLLENCASLEHCGCLFDCA